jgi:hypothetical protein
LRVAPVASDALVMEFHAINTMAGLGKHELVDTLVTGTAFEAVGVIQIIAGHDSLVEDRLMADATFVQTV